ncbi:MAG: hypothetical protein AMJ90_09405 [candidate division Zixibacteria bacterium SM23_73_2]|nr:MAG: hypothetical protein AMJ90_09405 [candidate division Zixibacteria bacterium SM23_73_2]
MPKIYLVEFKGTRKGYYLNPKYFPMEKGDFVVVQVERGEDMGRVKFWVERDDLSFLGDKRLNIVRKANDKDMENLSANREKEMEALKECKKMVLERNMEMKLVDCEFQFDRNKVTFYFTADKRIDFRELVRDLASVYKTRIELRQIGVRDEARRMGGYGPCGLKICCTTVLKDFEPISTQLAKEQNLPMTQSKISGNCGRLLCCLLYEKGFYEETFPLYPKLGSGFLTKKGEGTVEKINLFKGYIVVKHEGGEEEKVTLAEIRKRKRKDRRKKQRIKEEEEELER